MNCKISSFQVGQPFLEAVNTESIVKGQGNHRTFVVFHNFQSPNHCSYDY